MFDDYGDYDDEDYYEEDDAIPYDPEFEMFAHQTSYWKRYPGQDYMLAANNQSQ